MKQILLISLFFYLPIIAQEDDYVTTFSAMLDIYYAGNLKALTPKLVAQLQKDRLCLTDFTNPTRASSKLFRSLAYEALFDCGHRMPEAVCITNDAHKGAVPVGSGLCIIEGLQAVGINFNETLPIAKTSYGVIRIIMHHEAWHIVSKHYDPASIIAQNEQHFKLLQEREIDADKKAVELAQCKQCALECAAYFLQCHANNNQHAPLQKYQQCTIKNIEKISLNRIDAAISEITAISRAKNSQHPLDVERAFRIYVSARKLDNKTICAYHKNTVKKRKK